MENEKEKKKEMEEKDGGWRSWRMKKEKGDKILVHHFPYFYFLYCSFL